MSRHCAGGGATDHQPLRGDEDIKAVLSLKRPCKDCPFRRDVPSYLSAGWAEQTIAHQGKGIPFFCHKTTTVPGHAVTDRRARYCAGSLLYGEAVHGHILPVRLAMGLDVFDPAQLDRSVPVLDSPEALREHHKGEL